MAQRQIYLSDASIMKLESTIDAVRDVPDGVAVAVADNIFRPAGAGEPADRGALTFDGAGPSGVHRIEKSDGHVWCVVPLTAGRTAVAGMPIVSHLDVERRQQKRKLHTLVHATLAVATRHLQGLSVVTADIGEDAAEAAIVADCDVVVGHEELAIITEEIRAAVQSARRVSIEKAKSVDHARERFAGTFRLSDRYQLSGRVRLVVIDGLDANPCSGTHFDTSDIGAFDLLADVHGMRRFAARLRVGG